MAAFKNIKPGQILFTVSRRKMGNTNLSSIVVHRVCVVSVDEDRQTVMASWNGNPPREYRIREYSKWKVSEPVTVPTFGGLGKRLATREEKAAIKAAGREQA